MRLTQALAALTISLGGLGLPVGAAPPAKKTAILSPTSASFGSISVGQQSSPVTFTLKNTGKQQIVVSSVTMGGSNPSDFPYTNNCGPLSVGASCNISVTFRPATSGTRGAVLSVFDDASGSPQTASLTGSGIAVSNPPVISAVAVVPSSASAQITWKTDKVSNSKVNYGTSPSSLNFTASNSNLVTSHSLVLPGLSGLTTYYYVVISGDSSSTATFPSTGALSFTTCPCSIWSPGATPGSTSPNDSSSVELGVRFRTDVAGYITGIRFYKGTANTGTHVGNLWSDTGGNLASVVFGSETASGWQQANFSSPVAVAANTTYVASYYAPNGQYAFDSQFFATSGFNSPPLHALRDVAPESDGTYVYASGGGFPTNTYQSTNYWVDVVFTTTPPPTGPAISAVTATPSTTSATITWTTDLPSTSRVDYGTSASALNQNVSDGNFVTSHSLALSNLTSGTVYYYRVSSVDQVEVGVTSYYPPTNQAPASFITTNSSVSHSVDLSWNASVTTDVTQYKVYRCSGSTSCMPNTVISSVSASTTTYTDNNVTAGTSYVYYVTAVDPGGESDPSNTAPATIPTP